MDMLVSIDPGRKKCGLLLVDLDSKIVLDGRVVDSSSVIDLVIHWSTNFEVKGIVLGDGTTSKYWQKRLESIDLPIDIVEERGTTLRARSRFWEIWPPPIWMRWIPKGLLVPLKNLDAVAALVLLEDHLNKKFKWPDSTKLRISTEP